MMTNEELQEARGFEHCQEYDNCKADGIIENLLDHIDEQVKQIATLKANLIELARRCPECRKRIDEYKEDGNFISSENTYTVMRN